MDCKTEKAKRFWSSLDVDGVFDEMMELLSHLRRAIREHTATDRELVLAMNLSLEADLNLSRIQDFQDLLIGEEILAVTVFEGQISPETSRNDVKSEEQRLPLQPLLKDGASETLHVEKSLVFVRHECNSTCLSCSPAHPLPVLGLNPLQVPILYEFLRECEAGKVTYHAPCGRVLSCMEDVDQFLSQAGASSELQPQSFSFDPQVCLYARLDATLTSSVVQHDLTQGVECVPVSVCNSVDDARLEEFVYRRERWPHGCFLTSAPLFSVCCDCTDTCGDSNHCACLRRNLRSGGGYTHQRLRGVLSAGLWECGPWCRCNRLRCRNRVVQRGLSVRLQIFRTPQHRWSVRCLDDVEEGTFICIYAGVVHRLDQALGDSSDLQDPAPSDDEVEVVEEWTLPVQPREKLDLSLTSLHVPVIQNPAQQQSSRKPHRLIETNSATHSLDRGYFLDASKEGNVARFFRQSAEPNLFIQHVFTDTHDPQFPLLAFFSCRSLRAGTELSWSCSHTHTHLSFT